MREELKRGLELAKNLPAEALPEFLGEVEQIRVTALARITSPAAQAPDSLLEVPEVAARLGVSPSFVYHNAKKYKTFTRREGGRLLFSSAGLDAYLRRPR